MTTDRKVERHDRKLRRIIAPHMRVNARLAIGDRLLKHLDNPLAARVIGKIWNRFWSDQQHAGVITPDRTVLFHKASAGIGQRAKCKLNCRFDIRQCAATGNPAASGEQVLLAIKR